MNLYNRPVNHKPTVAIFTSAEGHLSLAEAAKETFTAAGYSVVVFEVVDGLFPLYIFLYQFFPSVSGFFFNATTNQVLLKRVKDFCKKRHDASLVKFFNEHQPDLLISTYFMYNPTLEELSAKHDVPLINILPDPKTIHPLLVSPGAAMNIAFDETAVKRVQRDFPDDQVKVKALGWLVRDRFNAEYDQTEVRQELRLETQMFTILLSTGSDGTNHILKILPSLLKLKTPLQLIVACGHNQTLLKGVSTLQKLWINQSSPHRLTALEFTPHLYRYVQAADLVLGKAGPNSLFETTACLKPFFAVTHISGQEDGNLDLIKEYHLGYVEEEPRKAAKLLQTIIGDTSQLKNFYPSLLKMAKTNHQTKTSLLQLASSLLNHDH
jgi:UDP-N-acetylglucosamine:LPS N-acetylglucosamine transferase